ncbi:PilN domain-containing protein [Candidatus Parcubacteria bacterium]|nr:PilN domain-containing protein [Candidatus Parcubacteria bacterium]
MINLLPPEIKQEFSKKRIKKMIMIFGILILMFLICLILILVSIKLYTQGQMDYQKILYEAKERQFKDSRAQEIQKEITGYNEGILKLEFFYQKQADIIKIIEKIAQILPSGAYLNSFSYKKDDNKDNEKESYGWQISISGYAPTRESLSEFRNNFKQENDFKDIVFPSSNWVKSIDINFSLSFKIK